MNNKDSNSENNKIVFGQITNWGVKPVNLEKEIKDVQEKKIMMLGQRGTPQCNFQR